MAAFVAVAEKDRGPLSDPPNQTLIVASGAYTATASAVFSVERAQVVEAILKQTAHASSPSLLLCIQAYNPGDDSWETLIASSAITTEGTTVVQVNPYTAPITNGSAQRVVRRKLRVTVEHANTDSATYSILLAAA